MAKSHLQFSLFTMELKSQSDQYTHNYLHTQAIQGSDDHRGFENTHITLLSPKSKSSVEPSGYWQHVHYIPQLPCCKPKFQTSLQTHFLTKKKKKNGCKQPILPHHIVQVPRSRTQQHVHSSYQHGNHSANCPPSLSVCLVSLFYHENQ
jgi:hypothetical protein